MSEDKKAAAGAPAAEEKKEKGLSLDEIKKQLEESEKKAAEYLAGWQRERADFLNYKKEEMERIGQLIRYSNEEMILKTLPIFDNFEIAAHQNFPSENLSGQEKEKLDKVVSGFLQIKEQLQDFLKSQGVEEIKSIGENFDPKFHEVVEEVEAKDKESGTIIEEMQRGYKINGELLRPAKVKIVK